MNKREAKRLMYQRLAAFVDPSSGTCEGFFKFAADGKTVASDKEAALLEAAFVEITRELYRRAGAK